jgi:hypothetical protein
MWQMENNAREGACVDAWCARSELYRECGRWKTTQGKARVRMLLSYTLDFLFIPQKLMSKPPK